METNFRIEKKDIFRVVGYKVQTTNQRGEGRKAAPALWKKVISEGKDKFLLQQNDQEPQGLFGISIYNTEKSDSRKFDYMVASSSSSSESHCVEYTVPARTWAIFPCTKETIGKTESMAIMKWLPKSKYRPLNKGYILGKMRSGAPDLEHYGNDGSVEVWIAVEEK